jgi:hypothetical protein
MYLEKLQQPHMGYRVAEGGAWLWSFSVEPMHDVIDAPTGPAVEICELLGIPFARLRYALPDEMLTTPLAAALGAKSAGMMKPADAERLTGYRVGGVSAFGQKRTVPTVIDADAAALPRAFVNAGQRGLQARLAPVDLVRALGAIVAAIS